MSTTAPAIVAPAYLWVPPHTTTAGPDVAEFGESIGMTPDPEQRIALDAIWAEKPNGRWAAFEAAIVAPRQQIKALDVATEILTANRGWTTMGEVQVGDEVYHPDGFTVHVEQCSPVYLGNQCYRVSLTDGRSVVADAEHLWSVGDQLRRGKWGPTPRVLTTAEILQAGLLAGGQGERRVITNGKEYTTKTYRWSLPRVEPLKTAATDLPVDPYLLGAWLGDGTRGTANLTCHADDVPHWVEAVVAAGFIPSVRPGRTAMTVGITSAPGLGRHARSFGGHLRRLGVLREKSVPARYLTAGTDQREALLQGLMDTDGTVTPAGQAVFASTTRALADAVVFLTRSLGWRTTLKEGRATLNGRDCGPKFVVAFTPKVTDPYCPVRLARKRQYVTATDGGKGRHTVSITGIEPVSTRPVRCIAVESPDGLYLAGRDLIPTHNTFLLELGALTDIFVFDLRLVIFSAHEFSTCLESFRAMKQRIDTYPHLSRRVKNISNANGEEAIELHGDHRIRFRARTRSGGRGLTGDKVYLDEAFALSASIIGSLMPTMSARSITGNPQILYGSSAGKVDAEILRGIRDRGRPGGDPSLTWIEWCAPVTDCRHDRCDHRVGTPGCALDDRALWRQANFAMGRRISEEHIANERRAMPPEEFARERLGWWEEPTKHGAGIDLELWEANARPGAKGTVLQAIAVEVAEDSSWAAVAAVRDRGDGGRLVEVIDYRKGTDWVAARVVEVRADSLVPVAAYPDGPAAVVTTDLAEAGIEVSALSAKDMGHACAGLIDSLDRRTTSHRSQPHLDFAVRGSVRQPSGESWRWSRKSSSIDISPLAAVTWALWASKQPAAETNIW